MEKLDLSTVSSFDRIRLNKMSEEELAQELAPVADLFLDITSLGSKLDIDWYKSWYEKYVEPNLTSLLENKTLGQYLSDIHNAHDIAMIAVVVDFFVSNDWLVLNSVHGQIKFVVAFVLLIASIHNRRSKGHGRK